MSEALLHPTTKQHLEAASSRQTHALLLTGAEGAGKHTLALYHAMKLLGTEQLNRYPYFLEIANNEGSVGIEQIRALRQFMQRKTTGRGTIRRVAIVLDADTMTAEAANALLKTLEEPPQDTVIILTASSPGRVPVTVRSRTQAIAVLPVPLRASIEFFTQHGYQAAEIEKAYHLSGGRPALMYALLGDSTHPLSVAIGEAKQLLTADIFGRLCLLEPYTKDKARTQQLLFGLERIISSLVQSAAKQSDQKRLRRMHRSERKVQQAKTAIDRNGSLKLILTDLCINM